MGFGLTLPVLRNLPPHQALFLGSGIDVAADGCVYIYMGISAIGL